MNSSVSAAPVGYERTDRIRNVSPRVMARIAGALYLVAVVTAVCAEFIFPGRIAAAAAVAIPVTCYAAVTVLLYRIFKPVSSRLALLAALSGLVGLAFEALQLHLGINLGMAFHGLYCLLIGYLMFKSTFLPRVLGISMAFAGLVWLIDLLPSLVQRLSPYNSVVGLFGEGLPMLWLLIMAVNVQRWRNLSAQTEEV
jgi:hypothetical protein